jgi:hypothetical protein
LASASQNATWTWNKVEHRLFSHISTNWRGRPLISHEVIVELIATTQTSSGLRVRAELDLGRYPLGVKSAVGNWPQWRYSVMVGTGSRTTPCHPPRNPTSNKTGSTPPSVVSALAVLRSGESAT